MLKKRLSFTITCAAVIIFAYGVLTFPTDIGDAVRSGMALCAQTVIPSLFPFFILSGLVIDTGLAGCLGRLLEKLMRPLFNLNGAAASALILGLVGGYPIGASCAASLYEKGLCTKTQAQRLLGFCNNSGPGFIIGAVGAGIFSDVRTGVALYAVHVCAALICGFVFRFYRFRDVPSSRETPANSTLCSLPASLVSAVKGAMQSSLNICAFVLCFAVAIKIPELFGVFEFMAQPISELTTLPADMLTQFFHGLLEVTNGVTNLPKTGGGAALHTVAASVLLGWAGLSVHCQTLSVIGNSGLSAKPYFLGKLLHGAVSGALTYLLLKLGVLGGELTAFAPVSPQNVSASLASCGLIGAGIGAFFLLLMFLIIIFFEISQNDWKSARK